MAAAIAIGMLRSHDEAADLLAARLGDPATARTVLDGLHVKPRSGLDSPLDRREKQVLDRLRADPRVLAALRPVGRILTLPEANRCPLTPAELATRPFHYPFENAATGEASRATPQPVSSGQ